MSRESKPSIASEETSVAQIEVSSNSAAGTDVNAPVVSIATDNVNASIFFFIGASLFYTDVQ